MHAYSVKKKAQNSNEHKLQKNIKFLSHHAGKKPQCLFWCGGLSDRIRSVHTSGSSNRNPSIQSACVFASERQCSWPFVWQTLKVSHRFVGKCGEARNFVLEFPQRE